MNAGERFLNKFRPKGVCLKCKQPTGDKRKIYCSFCKGVLEHEEESKKTTL